MRVVLGVHFRGENDRKIIFDLLRPHLEATFHYSEVIIVDSGHIPYNRAAGRNLIVEKALSVGADVVVIADADGVPQPEILSRAIHEANRDGKLHIPFDVVEIRTLPLLMKKPRLLGFGTPHLRYGPSCGGIYVINPKSWVAAGGQDERIVGWGFEDECFIVSVRTFLGDYTCHPGILYGYAHTRQRESETVVLKNIALRDQYNALLFNKEALRELQRGSNRIRPLSGEKS